MFENINFDHCGRSGKQMKGPYLFGLTACQQKKFLLKSKNFGNFYVCRVLRSEP